MIGESEIKRIGERVLGASRADQTEVEVFANDSALTRFANNYIHQNVEHIDVDVRVRAVIGQKIGVASTNELSDEALARVAARAYELAQHQRENEDFRSLPRPEPIRPGEYEVILEPYAVVDLLDFFSYLSLGALAFMEKRSFLSGRIGERVMGENVSIWDDGLAPDTIQEPFDYEGVPKQPVMFIDHGVAKGVVWDSYYAGKQGGEQRSTGHALPAGVTFGPIPLNMFLATGDAARDDMIRDVKRGIWVSRFWYTRTVHPLNVVVSGMTRHGTSLIEDGKIVGPVRNMRFTQGYVEALNNVDAISRDSQLLLGDIGGGVRRVPALKIATWNFTGVSEM